MTKQFQHGNQLHEKILNGVNKLADNVASTLGPKGRNVILHKKGGNPVVTKDGVTVAKFVEFEDPFENVGAQIIKQAADQTNTNAGDGTTTSTVLARDILNKAQKYLAAGTSPVELKRGMDKAVKQIVENLGELSTPVRSREDIEHIATISANGDKTIGKLIGMAVDSAGSDGSVTVEEGKSVDTTLDVVEGFRFDSGYFANAFVNNEKRQCISYEDAIVLVTDHKLDNVQLLLPLLEQAAKYARPLVIVAEQVEGQALAALIMNTVRGTMKVAAVKAPRYGHERRNIMKDLCTAVGATFVSRESGIRMEDVKLEHLGKCKKIEVLKHFTTIIDGQGDYTEVEKKIDQLKEELKQTDSESEYISIQERITRLASGVAIIKVGGATEIEMVEKRHRIEDALEAVRSAQVEGIVPGGGTALLKASRNLKVTTDNEEQQLGVQLIKQSLSAPIRQMALNAGDSPDLIVDTILKSKKKNQGWDFSTGKLVDVYKAGILDPAKVTRNAIENATSVASTLITTNYAIIED